MKREKEKNCVADAVAVQCNVEWIITRLHQPQFAYMRLDNIRTMNETETIRIHATSFPSPTCIYYYIRYSYCNMAVAQRNRKKRFNDVQKDDFEDNWISCWKLAIHLSPAVLHAWMFFNNCSPALHSVCLANLHCWMRCRYQYGSLESAAIGQCQIAWYSTDAKQTDATLMIEFKSTIEYSSSENHSEQKLSIIWF